MLSRSLASIDCPRNVTEPFIMELRQFAAGGWVPRRNGRILAKPRLHRCAVPCVAEAINLNRVPAAVQSETNIFARRPLEQRWLQGLTGSIGVPCRNCATCCSHAASK